MGTSSNRRGVRVPWHPGRERRAAGAKIRAALVPATMWVLVGYGNPKIRATMWTFFAMVLVAWLVVPAVPRALRNRRRRRLAHTPVGIVTPWTIDGYASERADMQTTKLVSPLLYAKFLGAALGFAAFVWYALWVTGTWRPEWGIALGIGSYGAGLLLTMRGSAKACVRYEKFPYRVGERVRLGFAFERVRKAPAVFDHLTFTLQALTSRPRLFGIVRPEVRRVFAATVEHADDLPPSSLDMEIEFEVPADAPGTDLVATPAVFWELAVEGDGPGFRYAERFRVPVYGAGVGRGIEELETPASRPSLRDASLEAVP